MFYDKDLEHYENDFKQIGIEDIEEIQGILNCLDEMAELTYYTYKNNIEI